MDPYGAFKKFGTGDELYILNEALWSRIGTACADSSFTIPGAFGSRVPNLHTNPGQATSESMPHSLLPPSFVVTLSASVCCIQSDVKMCKAFVRDLYNGFLIMSASIIAARTVA
ncbi:hypothetical protein FRC12_008602 [Ceratobasidium sp. 428]|nr:hypothetical protein FRC12_008602 [Ceratobasidium sp. 428]